MATHSTHSKDKLPLEMLYHWEKTSPKKVYLKQPLKGEFRDYTWEQIANQVRRMAAAIREMNFPDGSAIAILSKNCAHWIMSDLAIWMAGHVSVPLYPNLSANTVKQILEHSEAKLIFVGKLDDWGGIKSGISKNISCISFPYQSPTEFNNWDQVIENVQPLQESPSRRTNELATLIYTSGTSGVPKGVMHNFDAISFSASRVMDMKEIGLNPKDRFFSYLPLSHVAERLLVETCSLYCGGEVWFAESLETFAQNLKAAKPTIFLAVPRIWEKFRSGILAKMPEKKLSLLLSIPVLSAFIRKKIQSQLGLYHAHDIITGAAACAPDLMRWYKKLGLNLQEGYAMTENFSYSHYTVRSRVKIGCVGQPFPGVDVKISETGEILVKSHSTMMGYYKEPGLTKEAIQDGYLRTGDQGQVDSEGFLKITGRVKDLFKTAKGKYVAPTPIELRFSSNSLIEQVCIVGADLPQPVALVVLAEIARKLPQEQVKKDLEDFVDRLNEALDHHERIDKVVIVRDPWTMQNDLLTPTLKLKRFAIEKKYATSIRTWSTSSDSFIWEV